MSAAQRLMATRSQELPVVDEDGRPLCTVIYADIVRVVANGANPDEVQVHELEGVKRRRSLASPPPVDAGDDLPDVLVAMRLHRADHLGVVEGGQLVGVVSRSGVEGLCYEPPDGLPLPPRELIDLVRGPANPARLHQMFYESGGRSAETVRSALERNGFKLANSTAILDFGCGCGRVIRHWRKLDGVRLCGSDYNPALIEWCRSNLPFAEFGVNDLEPGLDHADGSFDLVYAFSVFTHLDAELQGLWMSELRRILRPGGLMLLTLHGPTRFEEMQPNEQEAFLDGRLVIREADRSGANACVAYHPERYVREDFGEGLELVEFRVRGAPEIRHDVALFRNPG